MSAEGACGAWWERAWTSLEAPDGQRQDRQPEDDQHVGLQVIAQHQQEAEEHGGPDTQPQEPKQREGGRGNREWDVTPGSLFPLPFAHPPRLDHYQPRRREEEEPQVLLDAGGEAEQRAGQEQPTGAAAEQPGAQGQ